MQSKYLDESWPFYVLILCMLSASYFFVYHPIEIERNSLTTLTQTSNQRAMLAEDALTHSHQYVVAADAIRHELGSIRTDINENQRLAFLLVDLDHAAHQRNIAFMGLDPERSHPAPDGLELTIHLRGHYGDLVHYIGDIVMTRTLIDIQLLDFQSDSSALRAGNTPLLEATIRVVLVKLSGVQGGSS